jgi:zinc and cadmium transporter
MSVSIYIFASVFAISLVSLLGIFFISLKENFIKKVSFALVSLAVGGLLGDAFFHLLPESFEAIPTKTPFLILLGFFIFFSLEKFLRWRHCHAADCEVKSHSHIVTMNIFGDTVHNFIDGMIIAASYLVSIPIGLGTTLAVMLHEIPQEIGDFSIFIHGGVSIKKALGINFFSALAAFLGAILALFLGARVGGLSLALLPFTAGGFLYIAGSDLIPELHQEVKIKISFLQLGAMFAGIALMALLAIFEIK